MGEIVLSYTCELLSMKSRRIRIANVTKYLENEWTILKTVSSPLLYPLYMRSTKIIQGMESVCLSLSLCACLLFIFTHVYIEKTRY